MIVCRGDLDGCTTIPEATEIFLNYNILTNFNSIRNLLRHFMTFKNIFKALEKPFHRLLITTEDYRNLPDCFSQLSFRPR